MHHSQIIWEGGGGVVNDATRLGKQAADKGKIRFVLKVESGDNAGLNPQAQNYRSLARPTESKNTIQTMGDTQQE
jgi:hypothetical protein